MSTSRIAELDGLRTIAVLLVFCHHAMTNRFSGGFIGVDIFFVLSGFLITSILTREFVSTDKISIGSFYMRRFRRLSPALLLMLAIYILGAVFLSADPKNDILAAVQSLYVMNISRAFNLGPTGHLGHTWSLGVEEQFYLTWPFVLALALRRSLLTARYVTAGLITAVVIFRAYLVLFADASFERTYYGFDTRADGLLIGCLMALLWKREIGTVAGRTWPVPAAILLGLSLFLDTSNRLLPLGGFTAISLIAAWLIAALLSPADSQAKIILRWRPIVWLGSISYGFYLWHYVLLSTAFATWPGIAGYKVAAAVLPLTVAVSALSFYTVERPILNFRSRSKAGRRVLTQERNQLELTEQTQQGQNSR